ncbi:MAG: alkaline phosphatase family protein, partial [Chitinophagaceae bacterium]|nr:alkaline phosphatase family protein [Chitinophagaceae bacterium]
MKKIFLLAVVFIFITNATSAQSQPYVILISFDGFRWDYPDRGLSPNIELMKENGVAASSLRPCFPSKTFPNHYAIVTGMYPENNGLIANSMYDPYHHRKYALSDSVAVKDGRWYLGEAFWETAERNGITTASYFWPGSEMNPAYRRPTYFEHYDHAKPLQDRVEGIIHWLTLPPNQRPHFLT